MKPERSISAQPSLGSQPRPWWQRVVGWFWVPVEPVSLELRPLPPAPRPAPLPTLPATLPATTQVPEGWDEEATDAGDRPQVDASPEALGMRRLVERLHLEEVDTHLAQSIFLEVARTLPEERWGEPDRVALEAVRVIMKWCAIHGPLKLRKGGVSVVALIGPTGVGKSTMLAKLASISAHKDKLRVGLITADSYRIGAVEQLNVYARLLGLPLEVVRTPEEMDAALAKFSTCDVVFVDTAGQSPNELERLRELEALFREDQHVRRFLVLSATTKHSDVRDILQRFEGLRYDGIIVNKLDESRSHGLLLNAPYWSGRPLVYLGVGQNVPADLELASRQRVAQLVLNLKPPSLP